MITDSSPSKDFGPRDGRTLKVVRVARASATDPSSRSVDLQLASIESYVQRRYHGDVEFIDITSEGSSGFRDRDDLLELERQIESGLVDLVICEDLSRISRILQVYAVCELCIDFGTRLIVLCDHIDVMTMQDLVRAVFANECHRRNRISRRRDPKSH